MGLLPSKHAQDCIIKVHSSETLEANLCGHSNMELQLMQSVQFLSINRFIHGQEPINLF